MPTNDDISDRTFVYDKFGKIVLMARVDGYVMCRRPGSIPTVLSEKEWSRLFLDEYGPPPVICGNRCHCLR